MIPECITGIDSVEAGDFLLYSKSSRYDIREVDKNREKILLYSRGNPDSNIFNHEQGWFPIAQFMHKGWFVEKQFMKYDPKQQGDTDDDI